jgi:hypothetical protein
MADYGGASLRDEEGTDREEEIGRVMHATRKAAVPRAMRWLAGEGAGQPLRR